MVGHRNRPVEDLIRSQLQNNKEFTGQRSFHFKLCTAPNFKSLYKNSVPSFDLPFGTVVEKKRCHARQTFEINCHFEFDENFDI